MKIQKNEKIQINNTGQRVKRGKIRDNKHEKSQKRINAEKIINRRNKENTGKKVKGENMNK